jgi:hypothetical protein
MTFIMPQAAAAVTLPYRWPRSLAVRVGHGAREGDMSKRLPNGLAWTLLGLTVVLLAATVVLGLTGGESWTAVFGFIPATLSFALVGALIAVRASNRLGWFFLAGAISMIVRYRRSGPEQRQQLKWFVYAAAVSALVDLDTVRAELLGVVDSAVQPAHISIWTAGRGPE